MHHFLGPTTISIPAGDIYDLLITLSLDAGALGSPAKHAKHTAQRPREAECWLYVGDGPFERPPNASFGQIMASLRTWGRVVHETIPVQADHSSAARRDEQEEG